MSSPSVITLDEQKEKLMHRCVEELSRIPKGFVIPVHMDLHTAMCVVGGLQLSLRHPANRGPSAQVARRVIDGIIQRIKDQGLSAHAELARLGDDPNWDS